MTLDNLKLLPQEYWNTDTAYLVEDYPYGFTLRCKIRYWLEFNEKHGYRFCSQTTNPKRPADYWNTPKKSTYRDIIAILALDEFNHIICVSLTSSSSLKEALDFKETYSSCLKPRELARLEDWIAVKRIYEDKVRPLLYTTKEPNT